MRIPTTIKRLASWVGRREADRARQKRRILVEPLEPRQLMAADIRVGMVYIEQDNGSDVGPDYFYVSFEGGAPNTQLTRLVLDADLYEQGFGRGDLIFDTINSGRGTTQSHPFNLIDLQTRNASATVKATVEDGSSLLILDFTNFYAGDKLVFSIDVDEVVVFDPNQTDLAQINEGLDPIASGIEFQGTTFTTEFSAPHYEDVIGSENFINYYDRLTDPLNLSLPRDDDNGLHDRTTGVGLALKQTPKPISIAGTVWVDSDEDLTIDTGEKKLGGVQIELFVQRNGTYVSTGHRTSTDSQGRYSFGTQLGLMPGTYQVRETQPTGYYSVGSIKGRLISGGTVGQTVANNPDLLTEIKMDLGDTHAIELNFAENLPATLSGSVCYVVTGMDCLDENAVKAPQVGVLIELINSSGAVIASTRTDAEGKYSFLDLRAGTYSVRQTNKPGMLDGISKAGSGGGISADPNNITQVVIGGGAQLTDYRFCDLVPAEVSGHVYYDANNSGVRDAGETPLTNVVVQLWNEADQLVGEKKTDSLGFYKFENLRPGIYRVTERTPDGYLPGRAAAGSLGGVTDSTGDVIRTIPLGSGASGINYDFGELLPGSIQGRVFVDVNGNWSIDVQAEIALQGVRIELLNQAGTVIASTTTDAQGNYRFDSLQPGLVYSVRETQPTGYFHGGQRKGSGGGNDSVDDLITAIPIGPGEHLINYDFRETPPVSIQGRVFVDINGNWDIDASGEKALGGVKIDLLNQTGTVVATTTTASDGTYKFEGLRPGVYTVRETQPDGYFQGGQRAGSGGGNDSVVDMLSAIDIPAGKDLVNYDFREIPPAEISGYVFADNDQNNSRGTSDLPIGNVTISLVNEAGVVVQTTVTDGSGFYKFTGLRPGTYTLRETQPAGYLQGSQRAGSGGGNHSLQDVISAIAIPPAAQFVEYNFYELLAGSISGKVFVDNNQTREREADERGLSGIQIDLLDQNGNVVTSTRTDADGKYTFNNLPPGTYGVREHHPSDYFQGGQDAPETGGDDSVTDVITQITVGSGQHIKDADFFELEPAKLSGYVFQDGDEIRTALGTVPDVRQHKDGIRTPDDKPIPGVTVRLMLSDGSPAASTIALPGLYTGQYIEAVTDASGYYEFVGLPAGVYHVIEVHPEGYVDSIDTPGSTGGSVLIDSSAADEFFDALSSELREHGLSGDTAALRALPQGQWTDTIYGVVLTYGIQSQENNFSEVILKPENPAPPPPNLVPPYDRPLVEPELFPGTPPIPWQPVLWAPLPLIVGGGHMSEMTWHLSVINGGTPRGVKSGEEISVETVVANADHLQYRTWTVRGMKSSLTRYISSRPEHQGLKSEPMFYIPEATPLMSDFNGDGFDEIALFLDGEWFIDANGNGKWDEEDIWLKLGAKGDQPVVGDWDGDGKDDIGVFGPKWPGDNRALASEPGLADPDHFVVTSRPKNIPRPKDETPDDPRLMQPSRTGKPRADVIDHVFRFGSGKDIAVSGDFNGDGTASIGTFRDGKWNLDTDGDGKHDQQFDFGQAGDLPLVGDFDGDGVDEMAIVRGNRVIVDSDRNGHIDATDQVFLLESTEGTVIVGDFDGDGKDTPALYQSPEDRDLQARRSAG